MYVYIKLVMQFGRYRIGSSSTENKPITANVVDGVRLLPINM